MSEDRYTLTLNRREFKAISWAANNPINNSRWRQLKSVCSKMSRVEGSPRGHLSFTSETHSTIRGIAKRLDQSMAQTVEDLINSFLDTEEKTS